MLGYMLKGGARGQIQDICRFCFLFSFMESFVFEQQVLFRNMHLKAIFLVALVHTMHKKQDQAQTNPHNTVSRGSDISAHVL